MGEQENRVEANPAMVTVAGIAVSRGFAAGPVFIHRPDDIQDVPEYEITPDRVEQELLRFHAARAKTHEQIEALVDQLGTSGGNAAAIFANHLEILEDVSIIRSVERFIRTARINAEAALRRAVADIRAMFGRMKDPYLRERVRDVDDVERRCLRVLLGHTGNAFAQITEPVIVVAADLTPSDTVALPRELVLGFATDRGSSTSHAALLARPAWMWGAEMGVNDCGVCIGNEAVFTRGAYAQTGLTGMDLVRLALERSDSAKAALEQIIALLEQYGQGGNCGFDHDFFYDNAFLILDRSALYVLETAGKQWVYKQYQRQSISNRLSIRSEGDACSGGEAIDFCRTFTEPVYTRFSGSRRRRAQTQRCLKTAESVQDCMNALRTHDDCVKNPFARGSVSSVCMHYGGMVGDHTTASMIVSLEPERTVVWATGSSAPCVSLFKPYLFGSAPCAPVKACRPSSV